MSPADDFAKKVFCVATNFGSQLIGNWSGDCQLLVF